MSYDVGMQADQTSQKIQELLAQAELLLGQAAELADEISIELVFRGQKYYPSSITPGFWESEEAVWNPSGGIGC